MEKTSQTTAGIGKMPSPPKNVGTQGNHNPRRISFGTKQHIVDIISTSFPSVSFISHKFPKNIFSFDGKVSNATTTKSATDNYEEPSRKNNFPNRTRSMTGYSMRPRKARHTASTFSLSHDLRRSLKGYPPVERTSPEKLSMVDEADCQNNKEMKEEDSTYDTKKRFYVATLASDKLRHISSLCPLKLSPIPPKVVEIEWKEEIARRSLSDVTDNNRCFEHTHLSPSEALYQKNELNCHHGSEKSKLLSPLQQPVPGPAKPWRKEKIVEDYMHPEHLFIIDKQFHADNSNAPNNINQHLHIPPKSYYFAPVRSGLDDLAKPDWADIMESPDPVNMYNISPLTAYCTLSFFNPQKKTDWSTPERASSAGSS